MQYEKGRFAEVSVPLLLLWHLRSHLQQPVTLSSFHVIWLSLPQWTATVDAAVTAGLQQPLLTRQASPDGSSAGLSNDSSKQGGGASGCRVVVNFSPDMLQLMREAKYLDQLGCAVPQLAVNLALQEGQLRCGRWLVFLVAAWVGVSTQYMLKCGQERQTDGSSRQLRMPPTQGALPGAGRGAGAAPCCRLIFAGCGAGAAA